jgi:hypothetical protein
MKLLIRIYVFVSLIMLEAAAFVALLAWLADKVQHAILLGLSVFLTPAWALLIYKEWKTL